ncbi:MAG TPA: P1 family peptidase [Telmatospirillum sp.]|nr:P1 family peptidase [Telmatospirillum sp.]
MVRPGPLNLITDVPGLLVGHATSDSLPTGVTTLLTDDFWSAGVDVRGGGPGAREINVLSPENTVGRLHAISLSGGSVFGLAAADGVVSALSSQDIGLRLIEGAPAVPIVPGAVLFDLSADTRWDGEPPYRDLGRASIAAASRRFALGSVGAGRGAQAGVVKGGVGSASLDLGDGLIVGALVAANPVGSVYMADGQTFWAWPFEIDGEFGGHRPGHLPAAIDPVPEQSRLGTLGRLRPGTNTTLAIVAVSAELSTSECTRLAIMAQDGLARAIRPIHTPLDGDIVFAVAKGAPLTSNLMDRCVQLARIGSAAADCLTRAIARAVFHAR